MTTDNFKFEDFSNMTHDDFVDHLVRILEGMKASELITVPGIWEVVSEHFNNEVLDNWKAEQE